MKGDNWFIAEWSRNPYTGVRKRHITVDHRIVADNIPGVGVDIRHQIRCEERGQIEWKDIEVWEFRDHGVNKVSAGDWKEFPNVGGGVGD